MNVVIYARISDEKQSVASIEAQLHLCREWCEREGHQVKREFVDRGASARSDERPAFQAMIKTVIGGLAEAIVVHKFDRFARNREDSVIYKALLRRHGITVISVSQPIDDTPAGFLLEAMLESLDAYFSLNLATETRKGKLERARQGFWTHHAPYGYELRVGILYPDSTGPFVSAAFEAFAGGDYTLKTWAQEAWDRGYFSRGKQKRIPPSHWGKILRKRVYTGVVIHDGQVFEGRHQALVPENIFEQVQGLLTERNAGGTGPHHDYLLSRLLWSVVYDAPMSGNAVRNEQRERFYYYRARVEDSPEHNIPALDAERQVARALNGVLIAQPEIIPAAAHLRLALNVAPNAGAIFRSLPVDEKKSFLNLVFERYALRVSADNQVSAQSVRDGFVMS